MRMICLAAVVVLWATIARANELVGKWVYSNPAAGETITLVFNADGTGTFDEDAIRYARQGERLTVTIDGEQLVYSIQLTGNQMIASGGDLEGRLTFVRSGTEADATRDAGRNEVPPAPAPEGNPGDAAPPAQGIVGTWTDGNGRIVFHADGSCDYVGQKMTYTYDGSTLTLRGPGGEVSLAVKIEGDTFTATTGMETQKLTRVETRGRDPAAGGKGAGGVFVCSETSVDPANIMSITQYLTLYPDGTIGWFKTELGVSRTQVSECLERFSSYQTNPQAKGQTYGTWHADDQGNIVLQWNIWDNLRCAARFDEQTGRLVVEKMGIMSEGATLTFELQQ